MELGFIVNPIAGMGGRVGLKGTDGVLERAVALGAKPVAPRRGVEFLKRLKELGVASKIQITTCLGSMGESEVKSAGLEAELLPVPHEDETTAEDTKEAVKLMVNERKVDLLVFVGGDGTARDVYDAMKKAGKDVPVLGVPAGVKMYSGVFAVNPEDAAEVVEAFFEGKAEVIEFEVMDADESAIRSDQFAVRLYGFVRGPFLPLRVQGSKQVSPQTLDERENQTAIAKCIVEMMKPEATYILGPGTTVKRVAELLGVEKTLLGVDIYQKGRVIKDVNEKGILKTVKNWEKTWIIVSPIGRQGILFGRGNQQISPEVIRRVGKERILVGATRSKIQGFEGGVLHVDTGDPEVDKLLKGYIKVITDYREWRILPVQ